MRLPKFARHQLLVHGAALIPLAWLIFDAARGELTANPIQAIEQRTGKAALMLLTASLACTPLNTVTGWRLILRWRRPLGLYAFMYAVLHFLAFIGLDYAFALDLIWADVAGKRYIFVGAIAWVTLLALALTSTQAAMKRLGARWKRLHRGAYVAGGLVIVHYVWAVKADIREPVAWGIGLAVLLVLRLAPVKRWFTEGRRRKRLL